MANATTRNARARGPHDRPDDAHARAAVALPQRARLHSDALFAPGASEVEIQHGEAIYRLRITSLGKLLLTK